MKEGGVTKNILQFPRKPLTDYFRCVKKFYFLVLKKMSLFTTIYTRPDSLKDTFDGVHVFSKTCNFIKSEFFRGCFSSVFLKDLFCRIYLSSWFWKATLASGSYLMKKSFRGSCLPFFSSFCEISLHALDFLGCPL